MKTQHACAWLVLGTLATPLPALAINKVEYVNFDLNQFGQFHDTIVVEHNGTKYDKIKTGELSWDVRIGAKCKLGNKIRHAEKYYGPDKYSGGLSEAGGPGTYIEQIITGAKRTLGTHNSTLKVPKDVFKHSQYLLGMDPIETCNFILDKKKSVLARNTMLSNGGSGGEFNQQIGFAVRCQNNTGSNMEYWDDKHKVVKVRIMCKGSGQTPGFKAPPSNPLPPGPKDITTQAVVTQVSMSMHPKNHTGTCPADLEAWATIDTNGATQVKYRLEDNKGALSPVKIVNIGQLKQQVVKIKFKIGKDPSQQGGIGGFQVNPGGNANPGGDLAGNPTASNGHQGFYRMKIIYPNNISSGPASYKVTCQPKKSATNKIKAIPAKPAGPGSLAPTPEPEPMKLQTR